MGKLGKVYMYQYFVIPVDIGIFSTLIQTGIEINTVYLFPFLVLSALNIIIDNIRHNVL